MERHQVNKNNLWRISKVNHHPPIYAVLGASGIDELKHT